MNLTLSIQIGCIFREGDLNNSLHIGIRPLINTLHQTGVRVVVCCEESDRLRVSQALNKEMIRFDTINKLPFNSDSYSTTTLITVTKPTAVRYQESLLNYIFKNTDLSETDKHNITNLLDSNNELEPGLVSTNF